MSRRRSSPKSESEYGREVWDRIYKAATRHATTVPAGRDLSDIVGRLQAARTVDVLDLGCGIGRWSVVLARAGFRVLAVDVSSGALRIARERAQREGLDIRTAQCAAQELSHLGVTVDAVVCNSVLDHMRPSDAGRSAESMAQVLKPGGLAYVSFDGPEESEANPAARRDFVVSTDGTRQYVHGSRRGMVWRFYGDAEIRELFRQLEELELTIGATGQRQVWLRKPCP